MKTRAEIGEKTRQHLQSLYVVGAGLGVAYALENMIRDANDDIAIDWSSALMAFAYLATLVPFFHGAMLYMDELTLNVSPLPTMINFLSLFAQTVIFFVMAEFIREPKSFTVAWTVLLVVDIAWVHWLGRREGQKPLWARINIGCVIVLLALTLMWHWPSEPELGTALLLGAIALTRTLLDYLFNQDTYFGVAS